MVELPEVCRASLARFLQPELFKALCEPARLSMLARLAVAPNPMTVSDLADCCGVHLSGVSRHLSILRRSGVVKASKRGREAFYELDCETLSRTLRGFADALDACRASCCTPSAHVGV